MFLFKTQQVLILNSTIYYYCMTNVYASSKCISMYSIITILCKYRMYLMARIFFNFFYFFDTEVSYLYITCICTVLMTSVSYYKHQLLCHFLSEWNLEMYCHISSHVWNLIHLKKLLIIPFLKKIAFCKFLFRRHYQLTQKWLQCLQPINDYY